MKNKFGYMFLSCFFIFSGMLNTNAADSKLIAAFDIINLSESENFISNTSKSDDTLRKEFKVQPGKILDLGLEAGGSIEIVGWNEDKLTAEFFFPRHDQDRYDISFNETENGVEIFSDLLDRENHKGSNIKVKIKVPSKFNLDIETKGGSIAIDNVNGEISGRTYGGSLSFAKLSGNIDFKTYGGEINLENSKIDGSLETMGGSILLKDVEGDISGKTMGGSVKYINVKNPGKNKPINVSTMGGNVELDKVFSGSKVYTAGGSIEIGSAKDFVQAKTMGGNININEMDGGVEATTMSGEIYVKLIENEKVDNRDVDLSSMNGDITLFIPAGYSFDLDAEINNSDRDFEIESDFEVRQSIDEDNVHAETSVNGGKYKISVHAVNGNIYLRKI